MRTVKYFLIALLVFPLMACSNKNENSVELEKQEMVIGQNIQIANELQNKDLKFTANETNFSKNNQYYFQITIKNSSKQPVNIKGNQIILVDTKGEEYKVGLIDRELTLPLESNQQVTGMIGFESANIAKPKFIKFKEV